MTRDELSGVAPGSIINHCPIDCAYKGWTPWMPQCGTCYGGDIGIPREEVELREISRILEVSQWPKYGGKPCKPRRQREENKLCKEMIVNLKECVTRDTSVPYYGEWESWQNCEGPCGQPGTRKRIRHCNPPEKSHKCTGPSEEEERCPTFCAPSKIKTILIES